MTAETKQLLVMSLDAFKAFTKAQRFAKYAELAARVSRAKALGRDDKYTAAGRLFLRIHKNYETIEPFKISEPWT